MSTPPSLDSTPAEVYALVQCPAYISRNALNDKNSGDIDEVHYEET